MFFGLRTPSITDAMTNVALKVVGGLGLPEYVDPHNRCACLNSELRSNATMGLKMAACFDGNCSQPSAYLDEEFQAARDNNDPCQGTCSVMQLCFSDTCINNASSISLVCDTYKAVQYFLDVGQNKCIQCDNTGNCTDGTQLYDTRAACQADIYVPPTEPDQWFVSGQSCIKCRGASCGSHPVYGSLSACQTHIPDPGNGNGGNGNGNGNGNGQDAASVIAKLKQWIQDNKKIAAIGLIVILILIVALVWMTT